MRGVSRTLPSRKLYPYVVLHSYAHAASSSFLFWVHHVFVSNLLHWVGEIFPPGSKERRVGRGVVDNPSRLLLPSALLVLRVEGAVALCSLDDRLESRSNSGDGGSSGSGSGSGSNISSAQGG